MKTLILSDVHLKVDASDADRHRDFIAFLRDIDSSIYERLVILGDLFDFWFEYRRVIFSDYFEVLRAFAELRDAGVELVLVCGNHDFWAGQFLEETLGFRVCSDEYVMEEGGQRILFVHGDGQNPDDWFYRLYKKFARARPVVWLFRQIHPDWAMGIARAVSGGSRYFNQREDLSTNPEVEALRTYARELLAAGHADAVVCGHAHFPEKRSFPTPNGPGTYVNSGDWLFHRTFVEWDGANFSLEQVKEPIKPAAAVGESPRKEARHAK